MLPSRPRQLRRTGLASALIASALTVSLVSAGTATPTPDSTSTAELPSPAVHYDFDSDDLTTDTITDTSGNDRHATLINASTAELVDGAADGQALNLPGGAQNAGGAYVELPVDVLADATDLTVSTRIRWDGDGGAWQWIYALGTNTTQYLFTTPSNGEGHLRTAVTTSGAGGEAQVTGSAAAPANEWKTITVALDTSAGTVTTYLDGASIGTASTSVNAADLLSGSPDIAGYIGRSFYPDPLFGGAVDDFRIYHTALSDVEVAELAGDAVPVPTGLAEDSYEARTTIGEAPALPWWHLAISFRIVDKLLPALEAGKRQTVSQGSGQRTGIFAGDLATVDPRYLLVPLEVLDHSSQPPLVAR
jgi:hypothetical protein